MSLSTQDNFFLLAPIAIFLLGIMGVKAFLILCALVGISVVQYRRNTWRREYANINNEQTLSPPATAYPEVFTDPLKSLTNPLISRGINSSSSNIRSREAAKCCGCARGKCDNNNCRCHKIGVPCETGCHLGIESYECRNPYGVRWDIVGRVK